MKAVMVEKERRPGYTAVQADAKLCFSGHFWPSGGRPALARSCAERPRGSGSGAAEARARDTQKAKRCRK